MPALSPRDRRAVTLGALVVSLAALGAGMPRGVARVAALREEAAEKMRLVEHAELVASRSAIALPRAAPAPRLDPMAVSRWAAGNEMEVIRAAPAAAGAVRLEAVSDLAGLVGLLREWRAVELAIVATDSGRGRDQRLRISVVLDPVSPSRLSPMADSTTVEAIIARNVFRADRRPSPHRFDPGRAPIPPAPPMRFAIEGVVHGPSPSVVVRPSANEPTRVLVPGDSIGGYRLAGVRGDSAAFVAFGDTTMVAVGARPR